MNYLQRKYPLLKYLQLCYGTGQEAIRVWVGGTGQEAIRVWVGGSLCNAIITCMLAGSGNQSTSLGWPDGGSGRVTGQRL